LSECYRCREPITGPRFRRAVRLDGREYQMLHCAPCNAFERVQENRAGEPPSFGVRYLHALLDAREANRRVKR